MGGIEINSSETVKMNGTGKLYIDVEGTTANEYDEGDVLLGSVEAVSPNFTTVTVVDGEVKINEKDPIAGQAGTFALRVHDATGKVIHNENNHGEYPCSITSTMVTKENSSTQ